MIQTIVEDEDGNYALEFDDDGIEYLIDGLTDLFNHKEIGQEFVTPSVWEKPAPWWRFWDRSGDPVVGEFRLRRVA